jgi:hypothetical protein
VDVGSCTGGAGTGSGGPWAIEIAAKNNMPVEYARKRTITDLHRNIVFQLDRL